MRNHESDRGAKIEIDAVNECCGIEVSGVLLSLSSSTSSATLVGLRTLWPAARFDF